MKLRSMSLFCGLLAGLVLTAPAYAAKAGDVEVGAQYAFTKYVQPPQPDWKQQVLVFRGDYYVNKYFSLQGRVGFNVKSSDLTYKGATGKLETNHLYGVYAVGHFPLSDNFEVYGLAGWSRVDQTAKVIGYKPVTDTINRFSYGAGLRYYANKKWSSGIEYVSYYKKNNYKYVGVGVDIGYLF